MHPGPPSPSPQTPPGSALGDQSIGFVERLESRIAELEAQLEATHRLAVLGTLASMTAHEVNNLMTPIVNYAKLAMRRPDDPAMAEKALARAHDAAASAVKVTEALLQFGAEPDTEDVSASLRYAAERACEQLPCDPDRAGVSIEIELPDLTVRVAEIRLQQVFLNLVANAVRALRQHASTEGKIIRLSLGPTPEEDGRVSVRVSDNGPGVSRELIDRLFDPFVGDDDVASNGLGLAVCRTLLDQAGASLELIDTGGRGTTFELVLPI